jgi:hypothetical protein
LVQTKHHFLCASRLERARHSCEAISIAANHDVRCGSSGHLSGPSKRQGGPAAAAQEPQAHLCADDRRPHLVIFSTMIRPSRQRRLRHHRQWSSCYSSPCQRDHHCRQVQARSARFAGARRPQTHSIERRRPSGLTCMRSHSAAVLRAQALERVLRYRIVPGSL